MTSRTHNSSQRAAVERIVREVLADLHSGRSAPKTKGSRSLGTSPPGSRSDSQLTLTSKVVSAAALEGRLAGVSQLVVTRGAIITPAARDELKKHQVSVASAVDTGKPAGSAVLNVGVSETTYNATSLLAALAAEGRIEHLASGALPSVIESLGKVVGSGFGLLITDQSAAALCLANRRSGLRAALASSCSTVDAAVAAIGPNLLVVEPRGRSVFDIKQAIRHWLRYGQPVCPPSLQAHLD